MRYLYSLSALLRTCDAEAMKSRHIVTTIIGASVALSMVRITVLFSESWAAVRAERAGDAALLQICNEQTLAVSEKFRNACLSARADSASPVLLKTVIRSVHTAFADFCEAFNTPSRIFVLILFMLSGFSAPLVKAVCIALVRGAMSKEDVYDAEQENTSILVMPQDFRTHTSPWKRLRHRITVTR